MKVLKFGGTSVGTVESLLNVKSIVEGIDAPAVVVVSALGGLTDKLIATANMAAEADPAYRDEMEAISSRHFHIISNVVPEDKRPEVIKEVSLLLNELKRIYDGLSLIKDLPAKTLDVIVSFGERMLSVIVAAMIDGAERRDSLNFIKTEKWFDKNIADQKLTTQLVIEEFQTPFNKAIVPGFIATDKDSGEITTLGRGGSDFTGALIAAAMEAEVLEIWTDVDGFMTADPRIIPEAKVVPHMTFIESMELCTFGAKVIYPPTIYPVFHKNIPIKILNTFNPTAPGTLVTDTRLESDFPMKGVSSLRNTTIFSLRATPGSDIAEVQTRTFNAVAKQGIKLFIVTIVPERNNEFSFMVSDNDAEIAMDLIKSEFAPELSKRSIETPLMRNSLTTIAVVGEDMKNKKRLAERIRHSLHRDGIKVEATSTGASDTTITFIVSPERTERALQIIHSLVF